MFPSEMPSVFVEALLSELTAQRETFLTSVPAPRTRGRAGRTVVLTLLVALLFV